ncbi:MAG: UDP-N-acetylmuramate--L-alanine ligase [Pirellulales bacterium]|nr:UDP-N-acetylmuramate--L-alanine ligase [Pirellulales bacterium]
MAAAEGSEHRGMTSPAAAVWQGRSAHLVGVAGAGMRAMAEVLLGHGWTLSGSDLAAGAARSMSEAGVRFSAGHAAENLPPDAQCIIYSDAVAPDNPELLQAAKRGIPAWSYFQMAGRLMSGGRGLAVAGTHGKSTTTAMAAHVLAEAGCDPTVLCGAAPLGHRSGGRAGRTGLVLAEACEYRANFLHLHPRHAVILGIEPDHFDCFDSNARLHEAFAQFARSVPPAGLVLARHDCPATRTVTAALACRVKTFGTDVRADWSARNLLPRRARYDFEIRHHGRHQCCVSLRVPGRHNVLNALAAAALAAENGVPPEHISRALGSFRGLQRRMESLGTWRGALLLDDFAHHPTEVAAALQTIRRMAPGRRLWCVFQPHQASRTERLLDELAASLQNADRLMVAEIFRAREGPPQRGEVTAADLAREARRRGGEVSRLHGPEQIARSLVTRLAPGDVLVTMGAGDVRKIARHFIRHAQRRRAAG